MHLVKVLAPLDDLTTFSLDLQHRDTLTCTEQNGLRTHVRLDGRSMSGQLQMLLWRPAVWRALGHPFSPSVWRRQYVTVTSYVEAHRY